MIELAALLVLGMMAQWIAWRVKVPAIFPLIIIGLAFGPLSTLISPDGSKFINPDNIFAGQTMYYFVSLAVGVILFEGGLTLKFKEVRHVASTVRNLLLVGSIVMFVGGGLAAAYILGMNMRLALLFGALVIVTGPTVIAPILSSVKPNKNIATILKWEGIIIDPIGALVAVLVYELLFVASYGHDMEGGITALALRTFLLVISVGCSFGFFSGFFLYQLLKRDLLPEFLTNVAALGFVLFAFAGADALQSESGLLSVTVMGIMLANLNTPKIAKILDFKEDLTVLLISLLFIILASNIDMSELLLLGWDSLYVFAIVVFVLRPMAVFISTYKSNLTFREKLFISWIGPKGIVAAAVASLFSLYLLDTDKFQLSDELYSQVQMLVPLTFAIILGTVTLNGLTAKPLAKLLKVLKKESNGILFVGAHESSIAIAEYLKSLDFPVVLIDTSGRNVKNARVRGLNAMEENVLSEELSEELSLQDVGTLLALTPSNDLNIFACRKFRKEFGDDKTFRLITVNEMKLSTLTRPANILFGGDADFIKLTELIRKYPTVKEIDISSKLNFKAILENEEDDLIPLFIRKKNGKLDIVTANLDIQYQDGDKLAYIGPPSTEIVKEAEKIYGQA
ncbi:MAG: sodium:proton antiporter [Chitinophagales bacterium]|nr:sodium:proton antiporter [Chitinophagales bacterium]